MVFFACGVLPWLCRQSDPVGWLYVHWEVRSTKVKLTLEHATKAQRGSRGIVLLFL